MAQVKVYGLRSHLDAVRAELSDAIYNCMVVVLKFPGEKRFQRFIALEPEDFLYPPDRSSRYTIIEILMFEGRTIETKKKLIQLLYTHLEDQVGIPPMDLEIIIVETPRHNWGVRGKPADELELDYPVDI